MSIHCMHEVLVQDHRRRMCCWCGMTQKALFYGEPVHGPKLTGEHRRWHWEPSSAVECSERPADLRLVTA